MTIIVLFKRTISAGPSSKTNQRQVTWPLRDSRQGWNEATDEFVPSTFALRLSTFRSPSRILPARLWPVEGSIHFI